MVLLKALRSPAVNKPACVCLTQVYLSRVDSVTLPVVVWIAILWSFASSILWACPSAIIRPPTPGGPLSAQDSPSVPIASCLLSVLPSSLFLYQGTFLHLSPWNSPSEPSALLPVKGSGARLEWLPEEAVGGGASVGKVVEEDL